MPTFARTEPTDTQVTKSVIALLRYYGWMKFSILYEMPWSTVADSLDKEARTANMTVNGKKSVVDIHKCCELKMQCCQSGYWYQFIQETKNRTRSEYTHLHVPSLAPCMNAQSRLLFAVYVFLGTPLALLDMMNVMQSAQLFEHGEYMVIYVDMNTYSIKEASKYLWRPDVFDKYTTCHRQQKDFLKRARSLLVVVSTAPMQTPYENFTQTVRLYNSMEPFNFTTPKFFDNQKFQKVSRIERCEYRQLAQVCVLFQFVTIYAAYLYDSVMLYAKALHYLLYPNGTRSATGERLIPSEEVVEEMASNGTRIIETIISRGSYPSITGANMQLDQNGDSEGNFSVLALQPYNLTVKNFSCSHHMLAVGYFQKHRDYLVSESPQLLLQVGPRESYVLCRCVVCYRSTSC